MKLQSISYANLKGTTGTTEFPTPATLIHGSNFSHKTTVIDAIKLALLGFHPSLDKTPRGVFELSSGEELSVTADILEPRGESQYGFSVGRTWTRKGQTVTKKDFVPMGFPETPVVLLDANAYFGQSDRGKVEMMFAAGNISGGKTSKQLDDELEALLPSEHAKVSLDIIQAPQAFVTSALAAVEQWRSEAAASVRRMEGTLQGLSHLRTAEPALPLGDDVEARLTQLRGELEALQGKLADVHRMKALHEKTGTLEEQELADAQRRRGTLESFIIEKEQEKASADKKWARLLDPANEIFCPKCMANATKKRDADLRSITAKRLELVKDREALAAVIAKLEPRVEKAKERLAAADSERVMKLEEDILAKREEIENAAKGQQASMNERADRKRLSEAGAEHEKYQKQAKQLEAAKKYLLEVKAQMVRELFDPILKTAALFTKDILRGPIVFEDGTLGMRGIITAEETNAVHLGDKFISYRTFSGTEQLIAFAALQAALGATAPIKLVVMDELGRVDKKNKRQLFKNVLAAIEQGVIEQAIMIDTVPDEAEELPISCIKMTSE